MRPSLRFPLTRPPERRRISEKAPAVIAARLRHSANRVHLAVLAGVAVVAASGCTTVTPLQTASTALPGITRLGAQASASPYCSVSLSPQTRCSQLPLGVPVPEVRASGRHGIADGFDLGASAFAGAVLPVGLQFGLLADAKQELWSAPLSEGQRHLVALSAGAGFTRIEGGMFGGPRRFSDTQIDVPVAAWYGYQTPGWELVASPRFIERVAFIDLDGDGRRDGIATGWVGLTGSVITRGRSQFGVSIDYFTPTGDLLSGVFSVSVGGLWEFGAAAVVESPRP